MKSERRNLTQPPDHWAAFERQAANDGYTLSEWVGECCQSYLTPEARESLSERQKTGPRPTVDNNRQ